MQTYKIELCKNTYHDVFLPLLTKAQLKMPVFDKGEKVEVHIKRKYILIFIHKLLLRDIDTLEEIQTAFHAKIEIE